MKTVTIYNAIIRVDVEDDGRLGENFKETTNLIEGIFDNLNFELKKSDFRAVEFLSLDVSSVQVDDIVISED